MRIAVVVGTRPEAIKLSPVAALLCEQALVVHTGQHFSPGMSGHLVPDITLNTHDHRDLTRGHQLGDLVTALDKVFRQHRPDAVLRRFRPEVFVKGGDYGVGPLPEARTLAEWGGEAVVVPYVSGRSTTGLVQEAIRRGR